MPHRQPDVAGDVTAHVHGGVPGAARQAGVVVGVAVTEAAFDGGKQVGSGPPAAEEGHVVASVHGRRDNGPADERGPTEDEEAHEQGALGAVIPARTPAEGPRGRDAGAPGRD